MTLIFDKNGKTIVEDAYKPSDKALETIGSVYHDFYTFRSNRDQSFRQLQGLNLEEYWKQSRELFWNSNVTKSEDLEALGLDFSLPFIRKEVLDFTGRLVSMNISPKLAGDDINAFSIQVLQAMYQKWRFKSKDKVEKFWQMLYATMNGTVINYVGFDAGARNLQFLTEMDREGGLYAKETGVKKFWDDAFTELVPVEELYLEKIWERNMQKQNRTIRLKEMTGRDFAKNFPINKYPMAQYVTTGNKISDDSLFHQLLGGANILNSDKVQVLYMMDTATDEYKIVANGVWLNTVGKKNDDSRPNPFKHKMQPYTMSVHEPIDEKFAYGMSMPFKLKDTSKILNTSYTMLVERELRSIDPPVISSDFEAPELIFGQQRIIPVNDVDAYKEFRIEEASGAYFTMMNSLQGLMGSFAQGGMSQVAPSRQPRSAREIIELNNLKQQTLGNTLVLYYDLLHQEIMLLLKTMLQFYPAGRYNKENIVRAFTVPNFPLSQGGVGNLEVRFVKDPQRGLQLYMEAVNKTVENGVQTEIVEAPIDIIQNLEFYMSDIKLEPEKSDDLEKAAFNENILQPMLDVFVPSGVADIGKTYLRFLEKHGEHPSSFSSEQQMPQVMGSGGRQQPQMPQQGMGQQGMPQMPDQQGGGFRGRQGAPARQGNINQSTTGTRFGGSGNQGQPVREQQ